VIAIWALLADSCKALLLSGELQTIYYFSAGYKRPHVLYAYTVRLDWLVLLSYRPTDGGVAIIPRSAARPSQAAWTTDGMDRLTVPWLSVSISSSSSSGEKVLSNAHTHTHTHTRSSSGHKATATVSKPAYPTATAYTTRRIRYTQQRMIKHDLHIRRSEQLSFMGLQLADTHGRPRGPALIASSCPTIKCPIF